MTTSTRFSQYGVLLARQPASFWRERVIAVVKTVVNRSATSFSENVVVAEKKLFNVGSFIILLSGVGRGLNLLQNQITLLTF